MNIIEGITGAISWIQKIARAGQEKNTNVYINTVYNTYGDVSKIINGQYRSENLGKYLEGAEIKKDTSRGGFYEALGQYDR